MNKSFLPLLLSCYVTTSFTIYAQPPAQESILKLQRNSETLHPTGGNGFSPQALGELETAEGRPVAEIPEVETISERDLGALVPRAPVSIGTTPSTAILDKPLPDTPIYRNAFQSVPDNEGILSAIGSDEPWTPDFAAVFEGPCHFACRENTMGLLGSASNLVIYEDMRIEVTENGMYEVSFIAEVPDIPVVLSLQIGIEQEVDGLNVSVGSITLAPVVFETENRHSRHQPGKSERVVRKGYSHVLHRILRHQSFEGLSFTRHGNARFGSIPPRGDYSIILPEEALD